MTTLDTVSDPHKRAALLPYFEPDWLTPRPDRFSELEMEDFLLDSCERVSGPDGKRYWSLSDAARSTVVHEVPLDDLLNARADIAATAPSAGADLLIVHRRGEDIDTEALTDEELLSLTQVLDWLGPVAGLPSAEELRHLVELRTHLNPLASLLSDGFYGRREVLGQLQAFLDHDERRPFVLHGPGGTGKSTVLARIALDEDLQPRQAMIYLTFDRSRVRAAEPRLVLHEILRQLSLQTDEVGLSAEARERIADVLGELRHLPHRPGGVSSRSVQTALSVEPEIWKRLADVSFTKPILLILDTFEEVQRLDSSYRMLLWTFLDRLRTVWPGLKTIVAGRAPVPEAQGLNTALGLLEPDDARAFLRRLLDGKATLSNSEIDDVLALIPPSPLSIRLAADLLTRADASEDPYTLIKVVDGQIDGVLYDRILRHIADREVRRLAHPGLLLRRIAPRLILEVLADPCGLHVVDLGEAQELFTRLEAEATLVTRLEDRDGEPVLGHREDVRQLMLDMVRRAEPERAEAINRAAIVFYENDASFIGTVECWYHRLMIGPGKVANDEVAKDEVAKDEVGLDELWPEQNRRLHIELLRAVDEYPPSSKAFLTDRVDDAELDPEIKAVATDAQWVGAVEPRVRRRLALGQIDEAIELVRQRRSAAGASLLPRLEVEALERLGHLDDALDLASSARAEAATADDRLRADGLTLDIARIHERAGRITAALAEIDHLLPSALAVSPENSTHENSTHENSAYQDVLEALVVLSTWLRLHTASQPGIGSVGDPVTERREQVERKTVEMATSLPQRVLATRPDLYRDIVAAIGHLSDELLIGAAEELGVEADDEAGQQELTAALEGWDTKVSETEGSTRKLIEQSVIGGDAADTLEDWVVQSPRRVIGTNVSKLMRDYGDDHELNSYIQKTFRKEAQRAIDVVTPHEETTGGIPIMDRHDEPVSNGLTIDITEETQPETGGTGLAPAGPIEAVEGYEIPEPFGAVESIGGPERAAVDETLDRFRLDIGNATFGFSPETIHGDDDRRRITNGDTAEYPWRVHASLLITAADGSNWIGTGWFVSPRLLITAGHCVFIKGSTVPDQNGWVSKIRVIPGRDGSTKPFGEATSTTFYSVKGWTEDRDGEWDYGAIALDEPLGDQTGWLGYGVYSDSDLRDSTANISGYPGDKPSGTQWYAARRVDSVGPRKVNYDIDTAGGQSGSAVYRIKDGSRYGIAVHAYGGARVNSGTRINKAVFDNISKWKAEHS